MHRIEFRGRELDEFVAEGVVHLERMDSGLWFLAVSDVDGFIVHMFLRSPKRIRATINEHRPLSQDGETSGNE
jgi:hypothetical protein